MSILEVATTELLNSSRYNATRNTLIEENRKTHSFYTHERNVEAKGYPSPGHRTHAQSRGVRRTAAFSKTEHPAFAIVGVKGPGQGRAGGTLHEEETLHATQTSYQCKPRVTILSPNLSFFSLHPDSLPAPQQSPAG